MTVEIYLNLTLAIGFGGLVGLHVFKTLRILLMSGCVSINVGE